jgi:sporulation protein YabP
MAEQQLALPHKLTLNQRSSLTMTGVTEVVSFDENAVIVHTQLGALTVQGQQLQLKTLSVEGGQIAVEGTICALTYEEPRQKGGWMHRLFG